MNAPSAARHAWGSRDLEGYVLTLASEPLQAGEPGTVEVLNRHELLISAPRPGCFSGSMGKLLLGLTRSGTSLQPQTVFHGDAFDATVVEADAEGVTKIKFTFPKPLDSGQYRFYISSPVRPAQQLVFDPAASPLPPEDADLFARAISPDPTARREARQRISRVAGGLAVALASPIQAALAADRQVAIAHNAEPRGDMVAIHPCIGPGEPNVTVARAEPPDPF